MNRTKLAAVALGLAAAGGLGAALAYATTSDAGSITACVERDGTPRIVVSNTACKKNESNLTWAVQGPQGPAGPKGDQGAKGDPGVSGRTLTAIGSMAAVDRNGKPIMGGDGSKLKIDVLGVSMDVISPRDPATGQATGKRQHKPFIVTKQWDASSPVLMQACATNETIPSVEFFIHPGGSSVDTMHVRLLDAACAEVSDKTDDTFELEEIAFTFRRIEIEHIQGKTMYGDDWESPIVTTTTTTP